MIGLLSTLIAVAATPAQQTRLSLPFQGIWGVIQGFDSGETHVRYAAFALDFVPAQPKGTPAPPAGSPLTAFACYGRPVLAPADGTVVGANGDARDWPAYQKGSDPGNYVVIQHAPAEFSEFRHLAADSVKLTAGARVRRGDVIGRCGNSGNAGMPHLHIGFLSATDPITTRPMRFSNYERAGADDAWHPGSGFPVKGEILRPLAHPP
ncbi:MAG TPA: M23 family metallopeptidase [Polyangia bacterium]|nr:M23 family metallopeptidase [Polyangia bacterium]